MRLILTFLGLVVFSGSVLAEEELLDRLGLGGLVAVTVEEAEGVVGLGFAGSIGSASLVGGFSPTFGGAPMHDCDHGGTDPPIDPDATDLGTSLSACQDLNLGGLARLNGFAEAVGFLEISSSRSEGTYSLLLGSLSAFSNSASIGAVR